jgi:hypothetical protein
LTLITSGMQASVPIQCQYSANRIGAVRRWRRPQMSSDDSVVSPSTKRPARGSPFLAALSMSLMLCGVGSGPAPRGRDRGEPWNYVTARRLP